MKARYINADLGPYLVRNKIYKILKVKLPYLLVKDDSTSSPNWFDLHSFEITKDTK